MLLSLSSATHNSEWLLFKRNFHNFTTWLLSLYHDSNDIFVTVMPSMTFQMVEINN